jgi:hypothetical protein
MLWQLKNDRGETINVRNLKPKILKCIGRIKLSMILKIEQRVKLPLFKKIKKALMSIVKNHFIRPTVILVI